MLSHMAVRKKPGATAFTRSGASSTANVRVSDSIAPRILDGIVQAGSGRDDATPLVRVIEPPARMRGAPGRSQADGDAQSEGQEEAIAPAIRGAVGKRVAGRLPGRGCGAADSSSLVQDG
jgi:hypothetical protein